MRAGCHGTVPPPLPPYESSSLLMPVTNLVPASVRRLLTIGHIDIGQNEVMGNIALRKR